GAVELRILRIEPAPTVMVVRVIPDEVTVRGEGTGDVRPSVHRLADFEERALHAVVVEDPADLERGRVVWTVIEGERHLRHGTIAVVDNVTEPRHGRVVRAHPAGEAGGEHSAGGDHGDRPPAGPRLTSSTWHGGGRSDRRDTEPDGGDRPQRANTSTCLQPQRDRARATRAPRRHPSPSPSRFPSPVDWCALSTGFR